MKSWRVPAGALLPFHWQWDLPELDLWKWNESGFRPPLCTNRLNWARRTSWGWWDDWDDTVLQTQDSKFEPWRSEAEHATSRSRRLPTILAFTRGWGRNNFVSFKLPRPGTEPRTLAWKAAVLTTTPWPPPWTYGGLDWFRGRLHSREDQNREWHDTAGVAGQRWLPGGDVLRWEQIMKSYRWSQDWHWRKWGRRPPPAYRMLANAHTVWS